MRYIIISGIDGCGKTTIIEKLRESFAANGLKVYYQWLRYNHILVKPVHGLCRLVGLSREYKVNGQYTRRHEFYRSQIFCSFYILLTWFDTWLARFWLGLKTIARKNDIVICDRWVNDILIDLAVDTRRRQILDGKWYQRFIKILPENSEQYLIIRNTDDILSARPQSAEDPNFSFRYKLYKRLGKIKDISVVNNDGPISMAVKEILKTGNKVTSHLTVTR